MNRLVVSLAAAAIASTLLATPAHAQWRDLIKKKVAEKVAEKVSGSKPDSNSTVAANSKRASRYVPAVVGEELTEEVLDAAIRGMQAEVASGGRADSLDREIDLSLKQRGSVDELQAYRAGADRHRTCVASYLIQLESKILMDMSTRAHNRSATPAQMKKFEDGYSGYLTALTALMQRGDSAGAVKLRRDFWHSVGRDIDTRADTLAAEKAGCGTDPVKPAGVVAEERVDSLRAASRYFREQYHEQGAKASGLTAVRYSLAVERVRTWWDDMRERNAARDRSASKDTREHAAVAEHFWTDRETKLLQTRRDRLSPLMWKLYGLRDS